MQENFSLSKYREYEDDDLDNVPKQPIEDIASYWPVNEENHIVIHDHNSEKKVDSKHVEGDCLHLCFSSFELLKQTFRVFNKN